MRKPKPAQLEYRMILAPHFNERQQRQTTLLTIETTKAFATFRYELSVSEKVNGRKHHFTILGLKAPQLSLPATGTAQFQREYDELHGEHEISVESLDGTVNTFVVKFSKNSRTVVTTPKSPFIELILA